MADSDALRSRRKRLHAAGDHSLCRRCGARGTLAAVPVPAGTTVDPRAMLEALALRLAGAHEQDPADAPLARVLKDVLVALAGSGEAVNGELAGFLDEFTGA